MIFPTYAMIPLPTPLEIVSLMVSGSKSLGNCGEAKKHIEPPRLTSIVISPQDARIEPGKKYTFLAKGYDQHNRDISASNLTWKATGGTIDKNGVLSAGKDDGSFIVTVSVGEISGSVSFIIAKEGTISPKPIKPPPEGVKRLSGMARCHPKNG